MEEAEPGRLSRTDWVKEAYNLFEAKGVGAVSVDPLAKKLGVTRGSFYWHFKDRADLLRAVLDRWHELNTEDTIAQNERLGGGPEAKLLRLFETCASDDGALEMGIRAWASENATARETLRIVDARRIDYIATLLVQIGIGQSEADSRARVAYSAWLGEYSGAVSSSRQQRLDNIRVLHRLILKT
ncbi:TetR/AcrR family transcriptional regulator [Tabrizicola sp.]|uniref:TetR/AcrR family transcriptional regulator n=1 Tax=Tabrizicola sp. TaxID=2005166 RepID=UPI003F3797BE